MPDFKKLISKQYLFEIDRIMLGHSDKVILWIGSMLVALAAVLWFSKMFVKNPFDAKYIHKLFKLTLTTGFLEVVWFGARYENIMFFGTHFVAFVIFVIAAIWFVYITIKFLKQRKLEIKNWEKEIVKQKYLN